MTRVLPPPALPNAPGQLRQDPLGGGWVAITAGRAARPEAFLGDVGTPRGPLGCPFCPGNEHMTPPEVWADRDPGTERRPARLARPGRPEQVPGVRRAADRRRAERGVRGAHGAAGAGGVRGTPEGCPGGSSALGRSPPVESGPLPVGADGRGARGGHPQPRPPGHPGRPGRGGRGQGDGGLAGSPGRLPRPAARGGADHRQPGPHRRRLPRASAQPGVRHRRAARPGPGRAGPAGRRRLRRLRDRRRRAGRPQAGRHDRRAADHLPVGVGGPVRGPAAARRPPATVRAGRHRRRHRHGHRRWRRCSGGSAGWPATTPPTTWCSTRPRRGSTTSTGTCTCCPA